MGRTNLVFSGRQIWLLERAESSHPKLQEYVIPPTAVTIPTTPLCNRKTQANTLTRPTRCHLVSRPECRWRCQSRPEGLPAISLGPESPQTFSLRILLHYHRKLHGTCWKNSGQDKKVHWGRRVEPIWWYSGQQAQATTSCHWNWKG